MRDGDYSTNDFHLTLNTAKELAMIENNPRGKQVRDYFIKCEQQLSHQNALARPEMLDSNTKVLLDAEPGRVYEGKISELIKQMRFPKQPWP